MLEWLAPALGEMARCAALSDSSPVPVSLHISVYVTCLCDPEAVPQIPNCDVTMIRPDVYRILDDLMAGREDGTMESASVTVDGTMENVSVTVDGTMENASVTTDDPKALPRMGGGVAVCASGPASLIRETSNAVARLGLARRGSLDVHTEVFAL